MRSLENREIRDAIARGAATYFAECRSRVEPFVQEHFQYPGAWTTNRQAFGLDLLRAPVNLFWAPFYLLSRILLFFCQRRGVGLAARMLRCFPSGMETRVQRYLAEQTCRSLLQRDIFKQRKFSEEATEEGRGRDRLRECIVAELSEAADLPEDHPEIIAEVDALIEDALQQYSLTRTATSDIGNSLFTTLVGVFAFQKFTPGGFAIGFSIALLVANQLAAQEFILGESLGQFYYQLFPIEPSLAVNLASIAATMAALAVLASFSGLFTDPLQARLGLHRKRLLKMIDHLERDFNERALGSFRPKDQYLARLLDLFDAARSALG